MRPPIRKISANQFGSGDQSWRRAYSGTPLPARENRVGPHRHAPSDPQDFRGSIRFRRSILAEGVLLYAPTGAEKSILVGRIAMRPSIRKLSEGRFVSSDEESAQAKP
ncbi:hypothetical protein AMR42_06925 [Limnothrix sp. PR1529]|nr:hypothetical protein BCR12_07580 [Limnothrix sp. P13C2]PIB14237.1 hypothetical protein AMR42_06925 [Limnothrix sp. PR1529]